MTSYRARARRCVPPPVHDFDYCDSHRETDLKSIERNRFAAARNRIASLKEAEERITTFRHDIEDAAHRYQDARSFYFEVNRFRSIRREMQKAHIPEMNEIIAEHVLEVKNTVEEILADQQELMDEHRRMRVLLRRIADAVDSIKGTPGTPMGETSTPSKEKMIIRKRLAREEEKEDEVRERGEVWGGGGGGGREGGREGRRERDGDSHPSTLATRHDRATPTPRGSSRSRRTASFPRPKEQRKGFESILLYFLKKIT